MGSGTVGTGDDRSGPLVRDLVRSVVADLAPDELPLVEGLCRFDDATVVRRLSRRGGRHKPLGFGFAEVAALVTPVVWLVLDGVAQRTAESTATRISEGVTAMMRRLVPRRRPVPAAGVPPLTREQLAAVRALVLAASEQRGLETAQAEAIADAVVARLVLADELEAPAVPEPEPPAEPDAPGPATGQD
ncbi:hypothetical protein ACFCW6_36045 [Streptomyces sp. NPDC056333]|uniref:hypothetical protein n=1 Tax=Streptomyces sp. NPDC056333 TaxID=3345786 RepID=UPI0035DD5073